MIGLIDYGMKLKIAYDNEMFSCRVFERVEIFCPMLYIGR